MAFRDEQQASRERIRNLEEEVAALRAERADHEELSARLKSVTRDLGRANLELRRLRPASVTRRRRAAVVAASLVTVSAAGLLLGFYRPADLPVSAADASKPSSRRAVAATLTWTGKVRKASGAAVEAGATCELEARTRGVEVRHIVLRCGDVTLHDAAATGEHVSLFEIPDDGGYRYQLRYDDGRLGLNTWGGRGVVSGTSPPAHVEIALERDSALHRGDSLSAVGGGWVGRDATVRGGSGDRADLPDGERCRIDVRTTRQGGARNCVAAMRCGDELLYGGLDLGLGTCFVDPTGQPRTFKDDVVGDDPALEVDLDGGSAALKKRGYALRLELE